MQPVVDCLFSIFLRATILQWSMIAGISGLDNYKIYENCLCQYIRKTLLLDYYHAIKRYCIFSVHCPAASMCDDLCDSDQNVNRHHRYLHQQWF